MSELWLMNPNYINLNITQTHILVIIIALLHILESMNDVIIILFKQVRFGVYCSAEN